MSYFKWFISEGYKNYILWFLVSFTILGAMIYYREELFSSPVFVIVGSLISIGGSIIGLVYHSILTYRSSK